MTQRYGDPIVPSSSEPIGSLNGQPVYVSPTYQRFFGNLVGNPQPIQTVSATGSPFSFTASQAGSVSISGGTISALRLTRGKLSVPVSGAMIPVMNGDMLTITYSGSPAIYFIPS